MVSKVCLFKGFSLLKKPGIMALKTQKPSVSEVLSKRNAFSDLRLQDPELWDKVSWIKSHFIKDVHSGIRKMDFCKFVANHLGRTGYRDVWHLLKLAYPHVDRVRKGRKYMYWGIRHIADQATDHEDMTGETGECNNNELVSHHSQNDSGSEETSFNSCSPVVVKTEQDVDQSKSLLVMEFKEKEVFESFEDYEKSKEDKSAKEEAGRCVTPPRDIFTTSQLTRVSPTLSASTMKPYCHTTKTNDEETDLLKPENINRVCIPLINDVKSKGVKQNEQPSRKTLYPAIAPKTTNEPDEQQATDYQLVVVQDRGIQVCDNNNSTTSQRKKKLSQPSRNIKRTASRQRTGINARKKSKTSAVSTSPSIVSTVSTTTVDNSSRHVTSLVPIMPLRPNRSFGVNGTTSATSLTANATAGVTENKVTQGHHHANPIAPRTVPEALDFAFKDKELSKQVDNEHFKNQELAIKLLEEHKSQINSKCSSHDLQYTVDCLTSELDKERSLRLRLEIELRKVEDKLKQEQKMNARLAALLIDRQHST